MYAVSEVYKSHGNFKRGAVWAKIVVPNIPVQNGVVHIVDTVLGIVNDNMDQLLSSEPKCGWVHPPTHAYLSALHRQYRHIRACARARVHTYHTHTYVQLQTHLVRTNRLMHTPYGLSDISSKHH